MMLVRRARMEPWAGTGYLSGGDTNELRRCTIAGEPVHNRLPVGGLLLSPVGEWQFHEVQGVIVGRRLPAGGMLEIVKHHHNELPGPASHEVGLSLACRLADTSSLAPYGCAQSASVTGPLGA